MRKRTLEGRVIRVVPSTSNLINDAYTILSKELARLASKSAKEGLTKDETEQLGTYVRSLTNLSKEERAQGNDNLDKYSDEELADMLKPTELSGGKKHE